MAIFAMSGMLSDASMDNLYYSCMRSMVLLIILLIGEQLPRCGVGQVLRLQSIASSANKTGTVNAVICYQKATSKQITHSRNQM